jgi:hypothetical protein
MFGHRLPIHDLVETQLKQLGLRRSELARRCRFKNVNKGIRRIEGVCCGDLTSRAAKLVLEMLPEALEVSRDVVDATIRETADRIEAAERKAAAKRDALWRASFKPHAYFLGTDARPSSIVIFGVTGGAERWLKIPLDLSQPPLNYAVQALAVVRKTRVVPFFGATAGFIVNYTPDHAVRFDLQGDPVEYFPRAYCPMQVSLTLGGKTISAERFANIVGLTLSDGDPMPAT